MKKMTRVLMVPQQQNLLNEIQNNPLYMVTKRETIAFPKEGIINIIIDYEDYSDERSDMTDDEFYDTEESEEFM